MTRKKKIIILLSDVGVLLVAFLLYGLLLQGGAEDKK